MTRFLELFAEYSPLFLEATWVTLRLTAAALVMAMIGGAYWPIEIVSNRIMLGLSQALPMRHAMDAFKGLAYHSWGFGEVAVHVGYMAAFALVCTVVGIWLVDRRAS